MVRTRWSLKERLTVCLGIDVKRMSETPFLPCEEKVSFRGRYEE